MSKTRVLFLITDFEIGGAPRVIEQLACGLDRERFEAAAACLAGEGPISRELERRGIATYNLGARGAWDMRVFFRLRNLIRRYQPDILQCALVHANFAGRVVGALQRVPHVVASVHTIERGRRWHLMIERLTWWLSDCTVCVSESVGEHIRQACGVPSSRLRVIPNGIDYERFSGAAAVDKNELGLNSSRRTLIYIGRLDPVKGVDVLLWAMAGLAGRDDVQLMIVGDGPERSRLQQLVGELQLRDQVYFLGFRDDVARLLKTADAMVLPSYWEGLPLSVLEAMAAGVPVIAGRTDGTAEVVTDRQTGLLFPPGDAAALQNAISEVFDHPPLGQALVRQAQQLVREKYTHLAMIRGYEALYESLMSDSKI